MVRNVNIKMMIITVITMMILITIMGVMAEGLGKIPECSSIQTASVNYLFVID